MRIEAAGYGKLTSADSTWSQFKVAVTEPDGTLSYHTLDALGITEIDLMGDATDIGLTDDSVIAGPNSMYRTIPSTSLPLKNAKVTGKRYLTIGKQYR